MAKVSIQLLLLAYWLLLPVNSDVNDTMEQGNSLRDDQAGKLNAGNFTLQFFSPNGSKNRYLGISYAALNFSRVVWVANRDNPLTDRSGVLNISTQGNLTLYQESSSRIVWSSNNPVAGKASLAQLSDNGNLVLKEGSESDVQIWQSFYHPTDTMLEGMEIGGDRFLTSWKSESDPSPGRFTYRVGSGRSGSTEMYIQASNGSVVYRTGPWDATRRRFSGNPQQTKAGDDIDFKLSDGDDQVYYSFNVAKGGAYSASWLVLTPDGQTGRNATSRNGTVVYLWSSPTGCDYYNVCGKNSLCKEPERACECLPGFKPGTSGGECEREQQLNCESSYFVKVHDVKLPDTKQATVDSAVGGESECEEKCRADCSCVAYSTIFITTTVEMSCMRWSGDLLDMRDFPDAVAQYDLFLKLPAKKSNNTAVIAGTVTSSIILLILLTLLGFHLWRRLTSQPPRESEAVYSMETRHDWGAEEFCLFDFATVATATKHFSDQIGVGGFASVYKGIMSDGQVVAVKRFSKTAPERGVMDGFLNEARLIAKLQHRNLVRLLGCCCDGGERMLIYEHMSNGSLDKFIFDETKRPMLHWETRTKIVQGVSKGILYLHEDSRLKIIHRDLKAANVLLDEEMNPKISDFGTAKIIMADQSEDTTMNVIGTLGYISPEYAIDGTFSVKSDVFSFGVLMLEIISGMRNSKITPRASIGELQDKNLLALTWRLWNSGDGLKLLDEMIPNPNPKQVKRYIQIALLCVQESADDRPTMSEVNSMLTSEDRNLSEPYRPGIYQGRFTTSGHNQSSGSGTAVRMTVTGIEGR